MWRGVVADSIQDGYLHFPDPSTRLKFGNGRIFTRRFLDSMYEALTDHGKLSVMTDHPEYFEKMLYLVEADDRWCKTHFPAHLGRAWKDDPAVRGDEALEPKG